jgi:hypothetical protein
MRLGRIRPFADKFWIINSKNQNAKPAAQKFLFQKIFAPRACLFPPLQRKNKRNYFFPLFFVPVFFLVPPVFFLPPPFLAVAMIF